MIAFYWILRNVYSGIYTTNRFLAQIGIGVFGRYI